MNTWNRLPLFWPMICPDGSPPGSPFLLLIGWNFRHLEKPSFLAVAVWKRKLELQDDCFENPLRLLGFCYPLCFVFFLFLSLSSWGRAASSEHAIAYGVSLLLSRTGMVSVGNLDESKIFPRFWKISGKICSRCYELPRDLLRVFKECWMQI